MLAEIYFMDASILQIDPSLAKNHWIISCGFLTQRLNSWSNLFGSSEALNHILLLHKNCCCFVVKIKNKPYPWQLSKFICWGRPLDVTEALGFVLRFFFLKLLFSSSVITMLKCVFLVIISQPREKPMGNCDMPDGTFQAHHQSSKWGNIFWSNVGPCSRAPEFCQIYAKVHWSCSGNSWFPNT